jgi:AcrR family transcriptional regulator
MKKTRKSPTQERSQVMVESILESAARIFAEKGFAGTNTNLIAKAAGVSVGSLYQYFSNKEELIAALHERHSRELLQQMSVTLDQAKGLSLSQTIKQLVDCVLDEHLRNPQLHRILEVEFPFYEDVYSDNLVDQKIVERCKEFLSLHKKSITLKDLETGSYLFLKTLTSLSHTSYRNPSGKV